jgi:hypothetical protein
LFQIKKCIIEKKSIIGRRGILKGVASRAETKPDMMKIEYGTLDEGLR